MARKARVCTEYLHVIVRGIGKQVIYESDSDRIHYLDKLSFYCDRYKVTALAYCLMDNHAHLLLYDPEHKISKFMHGFNCSYAQYFNHKYDRCGHLFQNRYLHENITDARGLLAAYRYILNNPEKAGICKASEYRWSSFHQFGKRDALTDTSLIFQLLGGRAGFREYFGYQEDEEEEEKHLEVDRPKHNDEWARGIIAKKLKVNSGLALQKMSKPERDDALKILRKCGLSLRQIQRLTGVSQKVVIQAVRN